MRVSVEDVGEELVVVLLDLLQLDVVVPELLALEHSNPAAHKATSTKKSAARADPSLHGRNSYMYEAAGRKFLVAHASPAHTNELDERRTTERTPQRT